MKHILNLTMLLCGWLLISASSNAVEHIVKGVGVQFKPDVVFADVGDMIVFRDMPTHFVDTIKIPAGTDKMISKMGENYEYRVKETGIYFYKCPPHWGARMGGLILVGSKFNDKEKLLESLEEFKATVDDKIGQGYLKKIIKKIKNDKIKVPG